MEAAGRRLSIISNQLGQRAAQTAAVQRESGQLCVGQRAAGNETADSVGVMGCVYLCG